MRFTLTWKPDAEKKLAALWSVASNRDAVTADSDWIEQTLQRGGDTAG